MSMFRSSFSSAGSRTSLLDDWRCEVHQWDRLYSSDRLEREEKAVARIIDPGNIKLAWDHLAQHGGQAAGPDGKTFKDFTRVGTWKQIEQLQQELINETYQHGPVRTERFSKEPFSRGTRKLSIGNTKDRVASRAVAQILEVFWGSYFVPRSYCRSRRGVRYALAHAKAMAEQDDRWNWIAQDIQQAFDQVRLSQLQEVVAKHVESKRLREIIRRSIGSNRELGLYQGSPLSPLLMNLYLHHYIDLPWRDRHPTVPLLRYMDDILILGKTTDDLPQLQRDLADCASKAGLKLKHEAKLAEHNLERESATWLGFQFRRGVSGLEIHLTFGDTSGSEAARWRKAIVARFNALHKEPDAPAAAKQLIMGVIAWAGPAYLTSERNQIYNFLRDAARKAAFEEIPSLGRIQSHWKKAHGRWLKACQWEEEDRLGKPKILTDDEWESDDCGDAPF